MPVADNPAVGALGYYSLGAPLLQPGPRSQIGLIIFVLTLATGPTNIAGTIFQPFGEPAHKNSTGSSR